MGTPVVKREWERARCTPHTYAEAQRERGRDMRWGKGDRKIQTPRVTDRDRQSERQERQMLKGAQCQGTPWPQILSYLASRKANVRAPCGQDFVFGSPITHSRHSANISCMGGSLSCSRLRLVAPFHVFFLPLAHGELALVLPPGLCKCCFFSEHQDFPPIGQQYLGKPSSFKLKTL